MEIKINGKVLDASLENENTLGEVLASLEEYLSNAGHRISQLNIDGKLVNASMIEEYFNKEIKSINSIEIHTNVIAELTAASLLNLIEDIKEYENLNFEEKSKFFAKWKESATAGFISVEMPDLYVFCGNTFSNGDVSVQTLLSITDEIQREVNEPENEITNIEPILNEICTRLEELPLDIQTGKDARAAQTIQIFSAMAEKIFRVFKQLDIQGYLSKDYASNVKPIPQLITEFGNILGELLDAYEKNDSVLVGDITEYEASPKLKELYKAIIMQVKK